MEERDRGRLIANLKSLPNEIEHLVKNLPDDELRWRPIPGKWSIVEIICHVRDAEREVFQPRLRRSFYEDDPVFESFDQNAVAEERGYAHQNAATALAEFREARAETVRMLEAAPLEFFDRNGVSPQRGPVSVEDQVTRYTRNHDVSHLVQIKDIIRIKMPW